MAKIVGAHTSGTVGHVLPYTGATAPAGTLACDGSAVSRTTYAQLFALIGTTHGQGDGSTTFNLPDYRGRFHRGVDGSAGTDPDKASRTAMNTGGNTGNNVGSVQGHNMAAHKHEVQFTNASVFGSGSTALGGGQNYSFSSLAGSTAQLTNNQVSAGNETRPANAYVNYCICYN